MKQVIVVTGASSGFGALAARALARSGTQFTPACATSRDALLRSRRPSKRMRRKPASTLRAVELDVQSEASIESRDRDHHARRAGA